MAADESRKRAWCWVRGLVERRTHCTTCSVLNTLSGMRAGRDIVREELKTGRNNELKSVPLLVNLMKIKGVSKLVDEGNYKSLSFLVNLENARESNTVSTLYNFIWHFRSTHL